MSDDLKLSMSIDGDKLIYLFLASSSFISFTKSGSKLALNRSSQIIVFIDVAIIKAKKIKTNIHIKPSHTYSKIALAIIIIQKSIPNINSNHEQIPILFEKSIKTYLPHFWVNIKNRFNLSI